MYVDTFVIVYFFAVCTAINHYVLKNDGRIVQRIDSPFYLREPDNLVAFLNQVRYNDFVETSSLALLKQREEIMEHLRFSVQFGEELIEQAKCAMNYYMMEKRMNYVTITPGCLKRLKFSELVHTVEYKSLSSEPNCRQFITPEGPGSYNHLDSFKPEILSVLRMEPEDDTRFEDYASMEELFRKVALNGLAQHPESWLYHTIGSFYWRLRGQAKLAMECAQLGVQYAPDISKDIALLSLGTILFRIGRLNDSEVVLTVAVKLAPNVSENHLALASVLAMKHDFNRSLFHFDEAERLDPSVIPKTVPVRNFVGCLENLTKKTTKMYSYVEYMKNEIKDFKKLKTQILRHHEKLIQQQVPLGARYTDSKINNEELLKRGQYCSTRTIPPSEVPVLYCDLYSDIQMRLESNDVDIESLVRELKLTTDAVIKQVTKEFQKSLAFDEIKSSTYAQEPIPKADIVIQET